MAGNRLRIENEGAGAHTDGVLLPRFFFAKNAKKSEASSCKREGFMIQ